MSERLFLQLPSDASHGPESGAPPGTLTPGGVSAALRDHVAQVLLYREELPPLASVVERVVPDGAVRLVFNIGDAPSSSGGAAHRVAAIGASAEPALVRLCGRMEGVSVGLRAGAASAILGVPAGEIEGRAVHLDELWGSRAATRVLEQMIDAPDDRSRIAVLEAALIERLQRHRADAAGERAVRAAALIASSGGQIALGRVAQAAGVGERRLQQLFKAHVGLPPRLYARLARLHACLRSLRQRPLPGWVRIALDAGYYDQAHFVNDFKALCGLTPSAFLERAISGSSKTPS